MTVAMPSSSGAKDQMFWVCCNTCAVPIFTEKDGQPVKMFLASCGCKYLSFIVYLIRILNDLNLILSMQWQVFTVPPARSAPPSLAAPPAAPPRLESFPSERIFLPPLSRCLITVKLPWQNSTIVGNSRYGNGRVVFNECYASKV